MLDVTTVVPFLGAFNIACSIVLLWLFRNLRRVHLMLGVAFVLVFGVVELVVAVYFFMQGETGLAVYSGLLGIAVPVLSLAILRATTQ